MPAQEEPGSANLIPVVREMIDELYNVGNLGITEEIFHPDYVCHTVSGDMNRDQFKEYVRQCRQAVPDLHFSLGDIRQVGDVVEWQIRVMGTHKKELFGIPASGRVVNFWTENRMRLADGRPVEHWIGADLDAIVRFLGKP